MLFLGVGCCMFPISLFPIAKLTILIALCKESSKMLLESLLFRIFISESFLEIVDQLRSEDDNQSEDDNSLDDNFECFHKSYPFYYYNANLITGTASAKSVYEKALNEALGPNPAVCNVLSDKMIQKW